ncbi:MAG: lysophospholipid acyltransferase family protein [Phycisphaerales bacterium]
MEDWSYKPAADTQLQPLERLASTRREAGLITVAVHGTTTAALRAYLRAYHRLRVVGAEHLPKSTPFVMISNHESMLDSLVLMAALPLRLRLETSPVAAGDVFFTNPVSSALSALFMNALPIRRKDVSAHALQDLRERLASGHGGLILFPEGSRSRDGAMLPFKSGLGSLVAGTPVPVIPCHMDGPYRALPFGHRVPRPVRITVRIGAPLTFESQPGTREGWIAIVRRCEEAVRGLAAQNGRARVDAPPANRS